VSLIPVVHLFLQISPRIFEKIRNGPNGILWGGGKLIDEKNQKQKISWHCPFKWPWRKKIYLYANSSKQKYLNKIFLIEDFSIRHRCQWHQWFIWNDDIGSIRGLGERKWFMKKKQMRIIMWHCPFKISSKANSLGCNFLE
jgi:hypothetical protein